MGNVRFWRRFKIAPGVTLNISKTGFSFSFGPQGAKATIGTSGGRFTVGIPGTGLFYTHKFGAGGKDKDKNKDKDKDKGGAEAGGSAEATGTGGIDESELEAAARAEIALPPLKEGPRIPLNELEKDTFASACDAVAAGDEDQGLEMLSSLNHHPDAAFLSGLLLLRADRAHERAASLLRSAFASRDVLGHVFEECGRELSLELPITDEVSVRLGPDGLGAALAYVEALQRLDRIDEGIAVLEQLETSYPNHPLISMSLADLRAP